MATDRRLWFTHKCRFCSYFFVSEKDLVYHEATHDEVNFACDSCCGVFDNAEQLNEHVNNGCCTTTSSTEIGRQHVCGKCGEIFRFVRELYKHYGEHHMGDKPPDVTERQCDGVDSSSVCADCGAMFSGTASLKVHLWKAHNLNVAQQQDHMLMKNAPSNGTTTCHRLLVTASSEDKPFKCSMCNWSFKYDFSFRSHLKMHEEKQRLLGEMLRTNCESHSADEVTLVSDVGDNTVSSNNEVNVLLLPLKRKSDNVGDDTKGLSGAKSSIVCDTKCSRGTGTYCLTTNIHVNADCTQQNDGQASCSQQNSDGTTWKSADTVQLSSELLRQTPSLTSVIRTKNATDIQDCDEPFRFSCKMCSFKCRYDFSYIAHLNQHEKLKELEIDDLQSHLVASNTQTAASPQNPNKFAIKVIGTGTGDVPYVEGHTQMVDSSGISYILLCPGTVDQTALVSTDQYQENSVITQPAVTANTIDCFNSNVVFVDDINTSIEQQLNPARPSATSDDEVDFSVEPEMQFLDSTGAETLYVINEADLQVSLPIDSATEPQKGLVYEESAETEVVLSPQPSDQHLLDVVGFPGSDEDVQLDESSAGDDSYTCYFCNAVFNNKSYLQKHILRLHVD